MFRIFSTQRRRFTTKFVQYAKSITNNPKTAFAGLISFFSLYAGFSLHKMLTDKANEERLQRELAKINVPQQKVAFNLAKKTIDSSLEVINLFMQQKGIPGLCLCVMVDDQVVWSEGFGYADVEQQVLVRPSQSVFPVQGPIAALLRQSILLPLKAISPQDQVKTYLPDFPSDETIESSLDTLTSKQWSEIITKVTGSTYPKIVQSKLFDMLRLKQAFLQDPQTMIPYRVRGYHRKPELENATEQISEGFVMSAENLVTFAQATLMDNSLVNQSAQKKSGRSKKLDAVAKNYVILSDSVSGTTTTLVALQDKGTIVALQANLDDVDIAPVAAEIAAMFSVHHRKAFASIKKWFS